MRKIVLVLWALGCSSLALAEAKYGIVDMQAVILNVEEGKQAKGDLEKEIKAKEAEFLKKREELDKLNKDWQSQAALMSEEARFNKQKDFQEKFMNFRNEEVAFREEIKRKEQKATQNIAIKVAGLVEKLSKEKHLDAVFETNSAGLLYLSSPMDLTKEVIEKYSKEAKSVAKSGKEKEKSGAKDAAKN